MGQVEGPEAQLNSDIIFRVAHWLHVLKSKRRVVQIYFPSLNEFGSCTTVLSYLKWILNTSIGQNPLLKKFSGSEVRLDTTFHTNWPDLATKNIAIITLFGSYYIVRSK